MGGSGSSSGESSMSYISQSSSKYLLIYSLEVTRNVDLDMKTSTIASDNYLKQESQSQK